MKEVLFKTIVLMLFFAGMVWSIYAFMSALLDATLAISAGAERIVFDKGAFYLLGAASGLADLLFIMVYQGVLKKELSARVTKWFSRVAVLSILVAVILPTASHLTISRIVENKGYEVSAQESNSWLYLSEIVYTRSK